MKALILLAMWTGAGAFCAWRNPPAGGTIERLLALMFWPFFIGHRPPPPPGPVDRLRRALGTGDAAAALAVELDQALGRMAERVRRLEAGIEAAGPGSQHLLIEAARAAQADLRAAMDAVDTAATQLLIARDLDRPGDVDGLLRALRARVLADAELSGQPGRAPTPSEPGMPTSGLDAV